MSVRSSTARPSVVRPQQPVDDDVCKADVGASVDLSDKPTAVPSYARPTTCSQRRSSAVAVQSSRPSGIWASVTRPHSAKNATQDSGLRSSVSCVQPTKQAPRTTQPQVKTSSRRSIIDAGPSKRLSSIQTRTQSSKSYRVSDSDAAADQEPQLSKSEPHFGSCEPVSRGSSSRATHSSVSGATQTATGHRPTSASSQDTTATSTVQRPSTRRQSESAPRPKAAAKQQRHTAPGTAPIAQGNSSYAKQHKQVTPRAFLDSSKTAVSARSAKTTPVGGAATTSTRSAGRQLQALGRRSTPGAAETDNLPFPSGTAAPASSRAADTGVASSRNGAVPAPTAQQGPRAPTVKTPPAAIAKAKPSSSISKQPGAVSAGNAATGTAPRLSTGYAAIRATPRGATAVALRAAGAAAKAASSTPKAAALTTSAPEVAAASAKPGKSPAAAIAAKPKATRTPRVSISSAAPPVAAATAPEPTGADASAAASTAAVKRNNRYSAVPPEALQNLKPAAQTPAAAAMHAADADSTPAAAGKFTMLLTPGGPDWPAAGLVPYSITPTAKTAARCDDATPQQQGQQQHISLVPYSITPVCKTAAKASTIATPQQQDDAAATAATAASAEVATASSTATRSGLTSRAPTPRTPKREGYAAAAAARRTSATKAEVTAPATGAAVEAAAAPPAISPVTSTPRAVSPADAVMTAVSVVPYDFLPNDMSGLSIADVEPEVPEPAVVSNSLAKTPAAVASLPGAAAGQLSIKSLPISPIQTVGLPDYARLEAELATSPAFQTADRDSQLGGQLSASQGLPAVSPSAAPQEAAASAALSAAKAAAAEAAAAAAALDKELAAEAARLAATAAAQVAEQQQQQQLAQEAAAAAAILAAAAAAATAKVGCEGRRDSGRLPMSPPAAAAAGSNSGSSKYPVRPMRTPEASPMRARTPGRSPASAAQHAELAAKMQDLEITFQQYKVTRDSSPMVRGSLRNSILFQQEKDGQLQSSSELDMRMRGRMSSPGKFWELSPPAAVKAAAGAALGGSQQRTDVSPAVTDRFVPPPTAAAPTAAAAAEDESVTKQPAAVAAVAANMVAQYQELQSTWDAYKERREASPSPYRSARNRASLALHSPKRLGLDGTVMTNESCRAVAADSGFGNTTAAVLDDAQQQQEENTDLWLSGTRSSSSGKRKSVGASSIAAAAAAAVKQHTMGSSAGGGSYAATAGARTAVLRRSRNSLRGSIDASVLTTAANNSAAANRNSSRRSSNGVQGLRASRRSSVGATTAAGGLAAPALVPRSPESTAAAAAAADRSPGWHAAAQWAAPSPDTGIQSPAAELEAQQQQAQGGLLAAAANDKSPQPAAHAGKAAAHDQAVNLSSSSSWLDSPMPLLGSPLLAAAAAASGSAGAAAAAASPDPMISNSSPGGASPVAFAGSPMMGVPPNSPAVSDGANMSEVAQRLAEWSLTGSSSCSVLPRPAVAAVAPSSRLSSVTTPGHRNSRARGSGGKSRGAAAAAKSPATTAAGSATLCWMLPDSPGTVEGPRAPTATPAAGIAAARGAANDPMQASWIAFNAAAAAAAPVAGAAAQTVTLPRFRLSGVGAADNNAADSFVAFQAQPTAADNDQTAAVNGSSGKGSAGRRARETRTAAAAATPTPSRQRSTPAAAAAASPAPSEDVFYTPMQFTPGSTGKKSRGSRTAAAAATPASAAAAVAVPPIEPQASDPAVEPYYTPAEGFTPGKQQQQATVTAAHCANSTAINSHTGSAAATAAAGNRPTPLFSQSVVAAAVLADDTIATTCSSSKRQKVHEPAAAHTAAPVGSSATDVEVSRQLLKLFDAAEATEQTPAAAEQLSRKYSLLQELQQQTPAAALGPVVTSAVPADVEGLAAGDEVQQSAWIGLPMPAATPVFQSSTAAAAADINDTSAAAFLTAMTPVMRSMGGFGSLSSRKLPYIGSGARRVPAAATGDLMSPAPFAVQEHLPATNGHSVAGPASAVRRSARLSALAATAAGNGTLGVGHTSDKGGRADSLPAVVEISTVATKSDADMTLPEAEGSKDLDFSAGLDRLSFDALTSSTAPYKASEQPLTVSKASPGTHSSESFAPAPAGELDEANEFSSKEQFIDGLGFDGFGEGLDAQGVQLVIDECYVTTRRRR